MKRVLIVALVMALSPAAYADGPAVSAINGKVDLQGGEAKGNLARFADGSLTVPVGHNFGAQLDGTYGVLGSNLVDGIGTQLFWRDPALGLIGATGSRIMEAGQFSDRFGGEAEYYASNWTLSGQAGYQNGFVHHGVYSNADLKWYATDNFAVGPEISDSAVHTAGGVAAEWQPSLSSQVPGFTLFGSAGGGDHNYSFALIGLRYYFSEDKSLKQHHREDDPPNDLINDITGDAAHFPKASPAAPTCDPSYMCCPGHPC